MKTWAWLEFVLLKPIPLRKSSDCVTAPQNIIFTVHKMRLRLSSRNEEIYQIFTAIEER